MSNVAISYDLPVGFSQGNAGMRLNENLSSLPLSALRFDGEKIIDVRNHTDWLIDNAGNKRLPSSAHPDVNDWQSLSCSWDDQLIFEAGVWRIETDADRLAAVGDQRIRDVKSEVARRIYAIASQAAQTNISAAVGVISGKTASARSNDEKTILADAETALGWVAAMRANVAVLVADPALDINDDANWPVTPPEVIALAAQF